jgi:hypothetical protein
MHATFLFHGIHLRFLNCMGNTCSNMRETGNDELETDVKANGNSLLQGTTSVYARRGLRKL